MKNVFNQGDQKTIRYDVREEDIAAFNDQVVHRVCATFVLAREIEWATRQYVLEMKDEDEEGIGTLLEIEHHGPAFIGDTLVINSMIRQIKANEIICSYEVKAGNRLIAQGKTGQKILKKEKLDSIFSNIERNG